MSFAAIMLGALLLDLAIGWPRWLFARIGHPVTWIGALISRLDAAWNKGNGARWSGLACVVCVVFAATFPAVLAQQSASDGLIGTIVLAVLAWPLVAARSLQSHVADVADPLERGDVAKARQAVAMIVGRDVSAAEPPAISRAALESLAENTSDGVVAPLFWGLLLGLPGIAAYKAVNTLDSMIGHRTTRHASFGWAAARLDDAVNWVPARLTGATFAALSGRAAAWQVMRRNLWVPTAAFISDTVIQLG